MLKLTLFTTTVLLFLSCSQYQTINIVQPIPKAVPSKNIVNVPIHIRDNGYHNFSTKVFRTQGELNRFLKTVKNQSGWNKKNNFFYTLAKQEIDFNKNNLVIYRFSEPSSSIVIATEVPTEINQEITVKIGKNKTANKMTSDMAYYALAYEVNKNTVTLIFDDGEKKQTINLKKI